MIINQSAITVQLKFIFTLRIIYYKRQFLKSFSNLNKHDYFTKVDYCKNRKKIPLNTIQLGRYCFMKSSRAPTTRDLLLSNWIVL